MRTARILGVLLAFSLTGCSSGELPSSIGGDAPARPASLPATLEGMLDVSVTEGDSEEDGGSGEINFGTLTVGHDHYNIEIEQKTLAATGVALDGPTKVRATLGANSQYGEDSYVITVLARAN
jgi:hypothetical protein